MPPPNIKAYKPQWMNPAPVRAAPEAPARRVAEEAEEDESLNGLQRSLVWLGAIMTAITVFISVRDNLQ
jgi:hypothetical protein